MVILPHKSPSVGNAHTFFASEQPTSDNGDEQILLIPFSEKTFAPKCASTTTTTLASAPAATTDTLAEPIAETKSAKSEDSLLDNVEESDKSVSSDRTNLTAGANQSISSSTEESNCEESSSGKPTSIHLKYITLDLLKRAASSYCESLAKSQL